jgi:hypothetical protein
MRDGVQAERRPDRGGPDRGGSDGGRSDGGGWRLHGFDHGHRRYGFEISRTGDLARVVIDGKAALELPRPVWEALLDAVELQRRHDRRQERQLQAADRPPRSGTGWSVQEDDQLRTEHASGMTVPAMASKHQRSAGAIIGRLEILGLIEPGPLRAISIAEPLQH